MSDLWVPDRLPEDLDSERSLLATCCAPGLGQEAAEVAYRLVEDDFVHPAHKAMFRAMVRLLESGLEISPLTLKDALDQAKALSRVGDFAGISEILSSEEVQNPHVLADILIRKRKHRELIHLGSRLTRHALEEDSAPEVLVEQAGQELFKIAQGQDTRGLDHIAQVAAEATQGLLDRLRGAGSSGVRVGFAKLDEIIQGFQPGNLVILAARPRIGKTALALNWCWHASQRYGSHVAFFSLEMSKEEVWKRLLSACSQINLRALSKGSFDKAVENKLLAARDELNQLPFFICDRAAITVREITAMVDRLCTQKGQKIDLLVIDYLQLISSPQDSRGAKQNESVRIGEISRALKLLAKDYNIPVIVLSQLNREVEHRQGKQPQLSDLRDSGAIEQDADIVMFIHRKERPGGEGSDEDKAAELIISKHRNGPSGKVPLWFEGEHTLFREFDNAPPELSDDRFEIS
jgi:replicative DNA helicase